MNGINKKSLILKLLWHAWRVYTETFPDSSNSERFLNNIQEAQKIVFEEPEYRVERRSREKCLTALKGQ